MIYSGYDCDNCKIAIECRKSPDERIPTKTYLVWHARKNGWSVGKRILCPACRKYRK